MRALVVGGAGVTGLLIVEGLAARGYEVTVLHRGVHEPPELAPYRHIHADPHFPEPVAEALGDETFDVVVITYGRLRALAPLFAGRCGRLLAIGGLPIYAGYAEPRSLRPAGMPLMASEDAPLAAQTQMTDSAAAKFAAKMLAAEQAVLEHHARGDYSATLFRYPQIYGAHSIPLIDWSFIKRAQDGRPFVLLPDAGLGVMTRASAANTVHCVLLALDHEAAAGQVFNCADDQQYTLGQWAEMILDVLGSPMEIVGLPQTLNWVAVALVGGSGTASAHALMDASKARSLLGYRDVETPREGLARFIAWRLANPPTPQAVENWGDPFDYELEDRVRDTLDRAVRDLAPFHKQAEAFHLYPHPKTPSLEADHRGR